MCTVIDADCILANLLQKRPRVTVRDLNEVRTAIEKVVSSVYVDISTNSLVWAMNQRPEMFAFSDGAVCRLKEWSEDYVDQFFNWRIPSEVRKGVLDALAR